VRYNDPEGTKAIFQTKKEALRFAKAPRSAPERVRAITRTSQHTM